MSNRSCYCSSGENILWVAVVLWWFVGDMPDFASMYVCGSMQFHGWSSSRETNYYYYRHLLLCRLAFSYMLPACRSQQLTKYLLRHMKMTRVSRQAVV